MTADTTRAPSRNRPIIIGSVIMALVLAVGVPVAVVQIDRAQTAEVARADAAALTIAYDRAAEAAADLEAALAESSRFFVETLTPIAEASADPAQFSEAAVTSMRESLTTLTALHQTTPESVTLKYGSAESLDETLITAYLDAPDLAVATREAEAEEARLSALAEDFERRTAELADTMPLALQAIRSAADAGAASGDVVLGAHDRASEETRTQLAAAVQTLRDLATSLAEADALETVSPAAFTGYTASADAVRSSHAEVLAAEAAAEAERQAEAERNSGGGSGGGGGSRLCTYLGFGGAVNIRPC